MEITLLCKVVDNFGDVGVAYRLISRLHKLNPDNKLNLIIDDLYSFQKINNKINPAKSFQQVDSLNIYNWNEYNFCYSAFSGEKNQHLQIILELFQCGRPDWMEKILFEDNLDHVVNIIMVDYLTAETYAEDFHKLQSLTRKAIVQKVNFMPGFTDKTGGLIIDDNWNQIATRNSQGDILFFCYDRDGSGWDPLLKALNKYNQTLSKKLLVAQGKGHDSLITSYNHLSDFLNYQVQSLDFLNQNQWDNMMKNCSFLFIRGEETMSRACLSGIPFVWHAYPQSDEYQLVKVKALLDVMKNHFLPQDFSVVEKVWFMFNTPVSEVDDISFENAIYEFLVQQEKLVYGFNSFSKSLLNNGDMAKNLLDFISEIASK